MNLKQNIFRILKATTLAACLIWAESSFAVGGEKPGEDHPDEQAKIPKKPSSPPKSVQPTEQRKLMRTTIQAYSLNGQHIIRTTDFYTEGNAIKTRQIAYPAKPPAMAAGKKLFVRRRLDEIRKNEIRKRNNKKKNKTPATRIKNNNSTIQMLPISFVPVGFSPMSFTRPNFDFIPTERKKEEK
jgi:hypothetical protein